MQDEFSAYLHSGLLQQLAQLGLKPAARIVFLAMRQILHTESAIRSPSDPYLTGAVVRITGLNKNTVCKARKEIHKAGADSEEYLLQKAGQNAGATGSERAENKFNTYRIEQLCAVAYLAPKGQKLIKPHWDAALFCAHALTFTWKKDGKEQDLTRYRFAALQDQACKRPVRAKEQTDEEEEESGTRCKYDRSRVKWAEEQANWLESVGVLQPNKTVRGSYKLVLPEPRMPESKPERHKKRSRAATTPMPAEAPSSARPLDFDTMEMMLRAPEPERSANLRLIEMQLSGLRRLMDIADLVHNDRREAFDTALEKDQVIKTYRPDYDKYVSAEEAETQLGRALDPNEQHFYIARSRMLRPRPEGYLVDTKSGEYESRRATLLREQSNLSPVAEAPATTKAPSPATTESEEEYYPEVLDDRQNTFWRSEIVKWYSRGYHQLFQDKKDPVIPKIVEHSRQLISAMMSYGWRLSAPEGSAAHELALKLVKALFENVGGICRNQWNGTAKREPKWTLATIQKHLAWEEFREDLENDVRHPKNTNSGEEDTT